jgi:hypothetical protein
MAGVPVNGSFPGTLSSESRLERHELFDWLGRVRHIGGLHAFMCTLVFLVCPERRKDSSWMQFVTYIATGPQIYDVK